MQAADGAGHEVGGVEAPAPCGAGILASRHRRMRTSSVPASGRLGALLVSKPRCTGRNPLVGCDAHVSPQVRVEDRANELPDLGTIGPAVRSGAAAEGRRLAPGLDRREREVVHVGADGPGRTGAVRRWPGGAASTRADPTNIGWCATSKLSRLASSGPPRTAPSVNSISPNARRPPARSDGRTGRRGRPPVVGLDPPRAGRGPRPSRSRATPAPLRSPARGTTGSGRRRPCVGRGRAARPTWWGRCSRRPRTPAAGTRPGPSGSPTGGAVPAAPGLSPRSGRARTTLRSACRRTCEVDELPALGEVEDGARLGDTPRSGGSPEVKASEHAAGLTGRERTSMPVRSSKPRSRRAARCRPSVPTTSSSSPRAGRTCRRRAVAGSGRQAGRSRRARSLMSRRGVGTARPVRVHSRA